MPVQMKYSLLFLVMLCTASIGRAQDLFRLDQIVNHSFQISTDTLLGQGSALNLQSNRTSLLYPLFWVYKKFISSQDSQSCGFAPTCSVYALQAIKKRGIVIGLFDGFDRLTRCNGTGHEHYTYIQETNQLIDEVD